MTPTLGFAFFLWTVGVVLIFTGARAIIRQRREAARRAASAPTSDASAKPGAPDAERRSAI